MYVKQHAGFTKRMANCVLHIGRSVRRRRVGIPHLRPGRDPVVGRPKAASDAQGRVRHRARGYGQGRITGEAFHKRNGEAGERKWVCALLRETKEFPGGGRKPAQQQQMRHQHKRKQWGDGHDLKLL